MMGKRRRTQINYRSIARCNLTNKVIRFTNAETQTSPSVVVSQVYVALERLDDRDLPSNSRDDTQDSTEIAGAASILLDAPENDDSIRNSLPLTLETSQENEACDSSVQVNFEDKEVLRESVNCQLPLDSCDMSVGELAPNDVKLQRAPSLSKSNNPRIVHSISLSSDSSLASGEGSQTNLDNKMILRHSLVSVEEENITQVNRTYLNDAPILISNRNVNDSSTSSSAEEDEEREEDEDSEEVNDRGRKKKKQKKYIRINAHTVHVHNHFYKN